jgi:hypothetical protein
MDPAEAVRRFLDALGVPPKRIPVDLDAQAAAVPQRVGRQTDVLHTASTTSTILTPNKSAPSSLASSMEMSMTVNELAVRELSGFVAAIGWGLGGLGSLS